MRVSFEHFQTRNIDKRAGWELDRAPLVAVKNGWFGSFLHSALYAQLYSKTQERFEG